jgi:DNA-3-methyladenine glycosylase
MAQPAHPEYEDLKAALKRDVVEASAALLGWELVRGNLRARIVETEAYRHDDPACHAFGKTKMKNMAIFGRPGLAYIYLAYGNHWMLNVVAHPEGDAAAVLIRAARPISGQDEMFEHRPKALREEDLISGPGKLAAAFGIDRRDNLVDLLDPASDLHLEPGQPAKKVVTGPRIGIALGKAHELPWRFMEANELRWVSKPWPRGG